MKCRELIERARLIILDFDGVIVDSESLQIKAWRNAIKMLQIDPKTLPTIVGRLDEEIANSLVSNNKEAGRLLDTKKRALERILGGRKPPLVAGVQQFLAKYKEQGHLFAVTSNSRYGRVKEICDHYRLTSYFEKIVAARDTYDPKPSPEVYRAVLRALLVPAADSVAVEDSPSGVISAKQAGIKVIGLRSTCSDVELLDLADCVVERFGQLL